MMSIGVFPLPIFLLPGGVTQLRVFEPRYKRLIKQSVSSAGFALSIYNKTLPFESSEFAVLVDIIDFDALDNGLFTITIQAKQVITLTEFTIEPDGLLCAEVSPTQLWSKQYRPVNGYEQKQISDELNNIFNRFDDINQLYPTPEFDNIHWVCARFLELLPLTFEQKIELLSAQSFEHSLNFLHTVVNGQRQLA